MINVFKRLKNDKVIPVIRTKTTMAAEKAIDLLSQEGFLSFELTMTTPGAVNIIKNLSQKSNILVGAGTILTLKDLYAVADAGAKFIVSPALVEGMAKECTKLNLSYIPGTSTPSEIFKAHLSGVKLVKLFPVNLLGGPAFIKTMQSVFPNIAFMPTGGISPENLMEYVATETFCIGMGGNLVSDEDLQTGNDKAIRTAARQVQAVLTGNIQ